MIVKEKSIDRTTNSPEIKFSLDGKLSITGRWIVETTDEFIRAINEWLKSIISGSVLIETVDINLEYIKNSNSGILLSLLRKIQLLTENTNSLTINWHYEEGDDDMREYGDYISRELGVPFVFIMSVE